MERLDQPVARDAERLGGGVEVEPVPALVLHFRKQDRLALERGRAADPIPLGEHPDDLGVGVLRDLPDERLAVRLGHPVARLDLLVGVELPLETVFLRLPRTAGRRRLRVLAGQVDGLSVHGASCVIAQMLA